MLTDSLCELFQVSPWRMRFAGISPVSEPMIKRPLGRGVNDFQKTAEKIFTLYMREDLNRNQNVFLKRYLEIDEWTVVLAAFDRDIRLRSFPVSLALIDICRSVGYSMRLRKYPLWQSVKDFQKNRGNVERKVGTIFCLIGNSSKKPYSAT